MAELGILGKLGRAHRMSASDESAKTLYSEAAEEIMRLRGAIERIYPQIANTTDAKFIQDAIREDLARSDASPERSGT